ncbi:MAG: hypothetical protein ACFFBT_15390, partial [Promethearchaeota archaeon]
QSDQLKSKPDHKTSTYIEQHYLDPRSAPKNKIKPPKLPPNYKTKNKIVPPQNILTDKPIQESEQHPLEPHHMPKNKIRPPKLPSNHITKNKIEPLKNKPAHKPINKIEQPTLEPHYISKNKITPPKLQPNYTPKNKISPTKPIDKKEIEKLTTQPTSEPNTHSKPNDWISISFNQKGNPLPREQKLNVALEYYNNKILTKLKADPKIQEKLAAGKGIGTRDLNAHGFSMFYHTLTEYGTKIKWNEFKEFAGYKININQDKYRFLNYDQSGNRLTKQEKMEIAEKHFIKVILPDLEKVPEVKDRLNKGKPPTDKDLRCYGHPGFVGPLSQKNPKIKYNELLRTLGFRPNVARGEYKFLNYDKNNGPVPSKEKLILAVKHFKEKIIPTLISKGKFKEGEQITRNIIEKNGFQHFTHALINKGAKIRFNQLLAKAGYEINIDHEKWAFLKYGQDGEVLSLKEKMKKTVDYFNNTIYPDLVQKGVIEKGEPPAKMDLINNDYQDFISAINGKQPTISFNELIREAGFEPKFPQDHKKWKIFYDKNMKPLSYNKIIEVAANYFKEVVLTDLINKKAILKEQNPSTKILKKFGHHDFFKAISKRGLQYNELLVEVGYEPNFANKMSEIGINFHWNAEKIFLEHTRKKSCNSFYEVKGNSDNSIIIDENFRKLSPLAEKFVQNHPKIKIVNIDYYLSAAEGKVLEHGYRGYQGENKALILVPINAKKPQKVKYDLPHISNVFILDPKTFADFIGYNGKIRNEFITNVELARKAPFRQVSEQIIRKKAFLSIKAIKSGENNLNYSTEQFRIYQKKNPY